MGGGGWAASASAWTFARGASAQEVREPAGWHHSVPSQLSPSFQVNGAPHLQRAHHRRADQHGPPPSETGAKIFLTPFFRTIPDKFGVGWGPGGLLHWCRDADPVRGVR